MTHLLCALALVAVVGDSVESRSLRVVVRADDDLSHYAIDAEFAFRIRGSGGDILFQFPGAASPEALQGVELDGEPLPSASIVAGVHPRFGSPAFLLRADARRLKPGDHTLRVRGPRIPAPARGLTLWGSWHPILSGGDVAIPIELEVQAPMAFAVVASGHRVAERVRAGMRTSRWTSAHPQGWGGLFLAMGNYRTLVSEGGGPALDVIWPEDLRDFDPMLAAKYPREILAFLEATFGRDETAQFRMVVFPERSIQNFSVDGLVGISTASAERAGAGGGGVGDYFRTVLAHELAHYWWGDIVKPRGPGWRWLTEGFAEYSRYLYERSAGVDPLPWSYRNLIVVSRFAGGDAAPIASERPDTLPAELYYQKGAFVLRMLASEIGDSAVVRAMHSLVSAAGGGGARIGDFQRAAERECSCDLGWFFEQWLSRSTGPRIRIDSATVYHRGSGYLVRAVISQDIPPYRVDVPVEVRVTDGTTVRQVVAMRGARQTVTIETNAPPERITVDPGFNVFKWYDAASIPVTLADVWRAAERGGAPTIEFGPDVSDVARARLLEFLRARFPKIASESGGHASFVVLVGEPAVRLREARLPDIGSPPGDAVQAFVARSESAPDQLLVGIEGAMPDDWPEIIPQAPLMFIRYRQGAVVSAMGPSLPSVSSDLRGVAPKEPR